MGQARALVDRFWAAFEAKDFAILATLVAPDCETVMPDGMRLVGYAQLEPLLRAYAAAFPDLRHETVAAVESGDTIAVELRINGTHTGPFQTPNGTIPATGKAAVWRSVDFITVGGGLLRSWHVYFDQLTFMGQLGLLPEPAMA